MTQESMNQDDVKRLMAGDYVPKRPSARAVRHVARGKPRERGTMNKGEARYADHLEQSRKAGVILWWRFEAAKIRLADNTFLTPDFMVLLLDGSMEFHDIKGRKGDGYWCEEDAKIKLKVAAETFPAKFKIVWPDKSGVWQHEEL